MSRTRQQPERILREQIRAARALLGWDQGHLAEAAGISIITVKRLEAAEGAVRAATLQKVKRAVEDAGVEFIAGEGHIGIIRRIKRPRTKS